MSVSGSTRAALVAAVMLTLAGCGASVANPTKAPVSHPPTASPVPIAPDASPTAGPTVYDTTPLGRAFDLPVTMTLPAGWIPLAPPDDNPDLTLDLVKTGDPPDDDSQWWGFSLHLVDGASVVDPGDIAKAVGAAKIPWPASYVDYLAGLPGVEVVDAAGPTKVGGLDARQVTLKTPPMHPTTYLKGDYAWLGGGASGIDPALTRHVIELTVHGKRLVIDYAAFADDFDQVAPQIDAVIGSIAFPD